MKGVKVMKKSTIIRIALLVLFAVMLISGYLSPEVEVVFKKATNICLECIGIGG